MTYPIDVTYWIVKDNNGLYDASDAQYARQKNYYTGRSCRIRNTWVGAKPD